MKKILFLTLFLVSFSFSQSQLTPVADTLAIKVAPYKSFNDPWIAKDKAQHFLGSFIATGVSTLSLQRFTDLNKEKSLHLGVSFSFTLGLGKELYDSTKKNNFFSYKDLIADLLGIGLAVVVFK